MAAAGSPQQQLEVLRGDADFESFQALSLSDRVDGLRTGVQTSMPIRNTFINLPDEDFDDACSSKHSRSSSEPPALARKAWQGHEERGVHESHEAREERKRRAWQLAREAREAHEACDNDHFVYRSSSSNSTSGSTSQSRSGTSGEVQAQPERVSENFPRGASWSQGAQGHGNGDCHPCAWNWKASGCRKGTECTFCHMCDEEAFKSWKQDRVLEVRACKAKAAPAAAVPVPPKRRPSSNKKPWVHASWIKKDAGKGMAKGQFSL